MYVAPKGCPDFLVTAKIERNHGENHLIEGRIRPIVRFKTLSLYRTILNMTMLLEENTSIASVTAWNI